MAFVEKLANRTYVSGSAFDQFAFVTLASDGQVDKTGAGLRADAVALQAATAASQTVTGAYDGRVTVVAAGSISQGGAVASDANGKAVAATTGDVILGYALEAGATGQVITIELSRAETVSA